MAFDREAAKADGYTDEQIDAYLASKGQPLPPDTPRDRGEEQVAVAQTLGVGAAAGAGDIALDVLKYGLGGAAAYGIGKKVFGPPSASSMAMPQQAAVPQQAVVNGPPQPGPADNRVRFPANQPAGTPQPAAQQPSVMQRGMDYARQMQRIAADKVMQGARAVAPAAEAVASGARAVAPAALGLTAAIMPGNAGQNYPFPQKGPYRGMEINPMTGRPWTPQELAQYR